MNVTYILELSKVFYSNGGNFLPTGRSDGRDAPRWMGIIDVISSFKKKKNKVVSFWERSFPFL